jgi:hypothetical protein
MTAHHRYEAPTPGAEDPGSEVSAKMSLFGMQTDVRYKMASSGAAFRVNFDRTQFEKVGCCGCLQGWICMPCELPLLISSLLVHSQGSKKPPYCLHWTLRSTCMLQLNKGTSTVQPCSTLAAHSEMCAVYCAFYLWP